jgi:signal transduction histidine kinase/CheY-like chemotaxis protein
MQPAFESWFARRVERVNRLTKLFLPPGGTMVGEDLGRARFFVEGWLFVLLFSAGCLVVFSLERMWAMCSIVGAALVLGPLVLASYRRTGRLTVATHVSLLLGSIAFPLSGMTQWPADPTALSVLAVVPLVAGFLVSRRAALVWLLVTFVLTLGFLWLMLHGYGLRTADASPFISRALNLGFTSTLVLLLWHSADQVRLDALKQAADASRARTVFLANVGHEIRTPMNGVLGLTEDLLHEALPTSVLERLAVVHRSGQAMVTLLNDLLDLSKVEANKLQLEQEDFDVRAVLSDVEALARALAGPKGLALKVSVEPNVPSVVRGDSLRLRQVLSNLLSNAVKFTESGEVGLEVCLAGAPATLRFVVRDTGAGISPEVQARLFQAFEQADQSITRRHGGSGLGLALSSQLVSLMRGTLMLESAAGQGARFSFTVPFEVAHGQPLQGTQPSPVPVPLRAALPVLVVDDNPVNLMVATRLTQRAGYQVVTATNGQEALDAVRAGDFVAVLMDCQMPVLDGIEATRRIRALDSPRSQTPIIALTASTLPEELALARSAGMNSVLTKPLSLERLRERLDGPAKPG